MIHLYSPSILLLSWSIRPLSSPRTTAISPRTPDDFLSITFNFASQFGSNVLNVTDYSEF